MKGILEGQERRPSFTFTTRSGSMFLVIDKFENIESMCLLHSRGGYCKIIEF